MRTRRRSVGPILMTALSGAMALAACSPFANKGTMPPAGPNGVMDASSAPDFIAIAGRDAGIAGCGARMNLDSRP